MFNFGDAQLFQAIQEQSQLILDTSYFGKPQDFGNQHSEICRRNADRTIMLISLLKSLECEINIFQKT